ncbi:uncharacterized protein LOC127545668 [Antechinus flavipes]|uniref:uncharacterized protein LOC127545668 n=1 Tax=Antechinus flavipes TaxID=38775 RepID=UPI002235D9A1|nr:uncharacterized protein LOC127545668 [Antechinus flavipes]
MWARPRLSSLFGLTCGLLWLYPVPTISCPNYQTALSQVKSMLEMDWLQSFMDKQGLEASNLTLESCKMFDYVPTVEALQNLSQAAFLWNVSRSLHPVERRLEVFKDSDIRRFVLSIQGLDNNICCLLRKLPTGHTDCSPSGSTGTLPSKKDLTFPQKLEVCGAIQWYQSFGKVVKKVLETWDASPGQRNRNGRSLLHVLLRHRRESRAD